MAASGNDGRITSCSASGGRLDDASSFSPSTPSSMDLVRRLDSLLPCARLPTDHDRASPGTPQPFAMGIASSSGPADSNAALVKRAQQERQAMLLALFGGLVRRYVRAEEVVVGLVTADATVVIVPMHRIVAQEKEGLPVADAAAEVMVLLQSATPLAEAVAEAGGSVDTALGEHLGTQAFTLNSDGAQVPIPSTWPLLCLCDDDDDDDDDGGDDAGVPPYRGEWDVCLVVHGNGASFTLRYNACLFSTTMAEAMLRSWETLLAEVARGTALATPLNLVPCVSPPDTQWLLQGCNQTAAAFAPLAGIHQLFEVRVDEAPHRIAVIGPSTDAGGEEAYPERATELTYGEVEAAANQVARYLLKQEGLAGDNRIVALFLERSVGFYTAMLGVLKAGAAYLSIDPDYPDERIQFMLEDSGAVALITTTTLAARIQHTTAFTALAASSAGAVLCLDDPTHAALLRTEPSTRPESVAVDPEWLCYVVYTSGSTGKPKGVQISHANALNLICAEEVIYCVEPWDRVLQGFSPSFDASVEEMWMAFNSGAALVVGTKDILRSGPDFPAYLEALGVTCFSTVPTLLATMPEAEADRLSNVRLIITGGEACTKELVNRWAQTPGHQPPGKPRRRFFNTYGPTEATVIATYKECFRGAEDRMSIGKPLLNYHCYIMDEHMNLLPPGAVGELVIGGVSVSRRGYLNLPEKTASVFVPDHVTGGPHPLYKSGDLARLSCLTGEIEYLGRADSQVKIRGYRVELSEIEAVLSRLPGVKSAVVDVQRGMGTMQHIIAFVLPEVGASSSPPSDATSTSPLSLSSSSSSLVILPPPPAPKPVLPSFPDTAGLLQAMREKLPGFMIPSQIEMVASFPTLPSGKVDRRRLPQVMKPASRRAFARSLTGSASCSARLHNALVQVPTAAGSGQRLRADSGNDDEGKEEAGADAMVMALSPFERLVAEAFEEVLGLPQGSIAAAETDFFDLGGNSLLVSLLVTRLRYQQPRITARDVYCEATVRGVAAVLDRLAAVATAATATAAAKTGTANAKARSTLGLADVDARPNTFSATSPACASSPYIPSRAALLKADGLQLLGMYFVAAFLGLNGLSIYVLYFHYQAWPVRDLFLLLAALTIALGPVAFLLLVAAKWLLLGRVREGDHPLWGGYHLRFWFVQCLDNCFRIFYLPLLSGTPVLPLYYWALGCRVGRDVFIDGSLDGYDLVEVGAGCIVNCQASVSAVTIEDNRLKLRRVVVGRRAVLGVRAAVEPGAVVGDGSKLEAMSVAPSSAAIPAGQLWAGAPCAFKASLPTALLPQSPRHRNTGWAVGLLQLLWGLVIRVVDIGLLLPFLHLVRRLHASSSAPIPVEEEAAADSADMALAFWHLVWLFAAMQVGFFLLSSIVVAGLRRVLLCGMRNRRQEYNLSSLTYFRQWAADSALDSLAIYTKQLRGTAYLPLWYRLMGARLGRFTEISSFEHVSAERLRAGNQAFLADDIIIGRPHVDAGGLVTHDHVRIGHRAFVGNASVMQTGTCIPDGALVGVASLAPKFSRSGETYVGCPPLKIKREGAAVAAVPSTTASSALPTTTLATSTINVTYEPSPALQLLRFLVEGVGFLALQLSIGLAFAALYLGLELPNGQLHEGLYVLTLPCFVMAYSTLCALLTVGWKWLIIGRFRAGAYPLYGSYVWRTEFIERIEENLLQTHAFPLITGTVWMQRVYQAMGVRLGKRAYLEYPSFCEHDLCSAGDYLVMERTATLQGHLFQDRVRTTGPIRLGDFCSVGAGAVVLLNGVMGDRCSLGTLSLVMRSEELPPRTKWHGLPAQMVGVAVSGMDEEQGQHGMFARC